VLCAIVKRDVNARRFAIVKPRGVVIPRGDKWHRVAPRRAAPRRKTKVGAEDFKENYCISH
jgi:hypothetical protein